MKLYHYHVKTPVVASVGCEDLSNFYPFDKNGTKDIDAQEAAEMHDAEPYFQEHIDRETCNLAEYLREESPLMSCITRIEPKELDIGEGKLYLITAVDSTEELDEEKIKLLEEYISGQFSDGWGEGLEQREVAEIQVRLQEPSWDAAAWDINMETTNTVCAYVYMHVWNSSNFWIITELRYAEDVPDPEPEKPHATFVASYVASKKGVGYRVKNVYKSDIAGMIGFLNWVKETTSINVDFQLRVLQEGGEVLDAAREAFVAFVFDGFDRNILPVIGFNDMDDGHVMYDEEMNSRTVHSDDDPNVDCDDKEFAYALSGI